MNPVNLLRNRIISREFGTYPDITSYQHVPGLVSVFVLSVELDGFEEGLHFTRLLLQEV